MRSKKRYMIAVSLLACLLGVNMVVNNASATVNGDELLKKVLLRGLPTCYSNRYMELRIEDIYNSPALEDLFTEEGGYYANDIILVPSKNLGNSLTQPVPGVSCLQVFEGYNYDGIGDNRINGLYGLYGKTVNPLEISKIGYSEKKVVEATKRCIYLEYSNSRGASGETGKSNGICFNVDSNGNIMDDPDTAGLLDYEFEEVDKEYPIIADLSQGTWATPLFSYRFTDTKNEYVDTEGNGGTRVITGCQDKMVFDELVECLNEKQLPSNLQNPNGGTPLALTTSFDSSNGNTSAGSEWWKKTNGYKDAIDYFTGGSGGELPNFSEQERFDLLSYYVQKVIDENDNISIDMDSCDADKAKLGEDYGVINNGLWCKISGWDTVGENFNVIRQTNDTRHQALETVDFEEVLKQLKEVDESKLTDKSGTGVTDDPNGGNVEGDEAEPTCMNAGGAQKLGWIVCTVMELLGTAAQDAYEDIVEPSLRVEPQLFSGGNGGVRGAWETFRNFANIAFIILFLVVIFSQLTGVGIDNYGIKKILPKLIVVAILINLSYVLCIVMVDLSNILGNALRGLFDGLGAGLEPSLSISGSDVNMDTETLTSTVITGVAILGALVTMGGMIWKNPAIVLSLLVAALGVAVSIFFLFVLLAIREAAIVVLVAIAPLAVVCYALPNTKKLFDKWWKFFEGLLLVYPICGLLVGGGNYVSKLLLTSGFAGGSFLQGLTAMIVGIVPIFFIPTVLKGSFAAMGKVGGMLTGMGDRARKGATSRVRENDRFKNLQQRGADRAKMKSLQRRAGGRVGKDGVFRERGLRSAFARTSLGKRLGADVAVGDAREQYVQAQASRMKAANNMNANMATSTIQGLKTELANESLKADVNVELGPKPVLDKQNLRTRTQNEINEALADNRVPALPVNVDLAVQRRRSARDAQETKAFMDQYSGRSQAQLREEARHVGTWLRNGDGSIRDGAQSRMSALLQTMEANGMENDMRNVLATNNMSDMSRVMQSLTGSKNAVFSSYGKRASRGTGTFDADGNEIMNNVSFGDYMTGTGEQSMQGYINDKGKGVVDKLDDKALGTIAMYQDSIDRAGGGTQIMNGEVMAEALARKKGGDELAALRDMISDSYTGAIRSDLAPAITGERAAQYDKQTLDELWRYSVGRTAMSKAAEAIASNPDLRAGLTNHAKEVFNDSYRVTHGRARGVGPGIIT